MANATYIANWRTPFRPFSTHSICAPPFIQCVSGTFNIFQGKHSPEKKENQQEEKQEQLDYARKEKVDKKFCAFFANFYLSAIFLLPTSGAARHHFSVALISCYLLNRILLFKLYTYFVGLFKL